MGIFIEPILLESKFWLVYSSRLDINLKALFLADAFDSLALFSLFSFNSSAAELIPF